MVPLQYVCCLLVCHCWNDTHSMKSRASCSCSSCGIRTNFSAGCAVSSASAASLAEPGGCAPALPAADEALSAMGCAVSGAPGSKFCCPGCCTSARRSSGKSSSDVSV